MIPAAQYVMMTFVNMYSPGLKILATHRVLRGVRRIRYSGDLLAMRPRGFGWRTILDSLAA